MRRAVPFLLCIAVVGCTKTEKPAADAAPDTAMAAPMAATLAASDIAGTWNMRVTPAGSDSTLLTFVFNATGDPSTWTFNFPGRPPVPAQVTFSGDSVMTSAGPYESVLRKGVQVTTSGVMRLQGGNLVGATQAVYAGGGDVVQLHSTGTRAP